MKETFTFAALPTNVDELKALPEACLDTPYKAAALAIAALCNMEKNADATFEMLDFLNGPDTVSPYTKQFLKDRLSGKYYKTFSFFAGATVENGISLPFLTLSAYPTTPIPSPKRTGLLFM